MSTQESLQQTASGAVEAAARLAPEQRAQIEETARQLATATPIPGVTTEMLETGQEVVGAGLNALGVVADVVGVVGTVVEVAIGVVSVVADVVGAIDLGGS